ncbi:hypothetical protein U4Z59_05515, partial [Escherichia coli]|nr:hypothetical protein [Escherichia coli]
ADRNRSHWSTSKTPSYTKSVSWQHHRIQENSILHLTWGDNTCEVTPPNQSNISESAIILPCKTVK